MKYLRKYGCTNENEPDWNDPTTSTASTTTTIEYNMTTTEDSRPDPTPTPVPEEGFYFGVFNFFIV